MTLTNKLVDLVKIKHGLKSNYGVAKLCGLSMQNLSDWKLKEHEASAEKIIILMAAADISAKDALLIMTKNPATAGGVLNSKALLCILCKIKRNLKNRLIKNVMQSFTSPVINF